LQAADGDAGVDEDRFWIPAGDRITAVLPGAQGVVIGDAQGHVHLLPGAARPSDLEILGGELSYFGHTTPVQRLAVDPAGDLVASAAADDSIRVWDATSGKPRPWVARLEGDSVTGMTFSPDGSIVSVLRERTVTLLSVEDGSTVAEFGFGDAHASHAFASTDRLFVGGEDGVLRQISLGADGAWSMRQLWRGARPLRQLASSPRGNYLVIADDQGQASLFMLAEGHLGERSLQLPGPVEEIVFGRSNARALFRTARWAHRVSLSPRGLHWRDSMLVPRPLRGGGIVFGAGDAGNRAYLTTTRNGVIDVVEVPFPGSSHPGLFGNRRDLLGTWRERLGYASGEARAD
jgi:hypothetical protein